jgi:protein-L-isoaspartate(D-aspartate) O-methyltransferase
MDRVHTAMRAIDRADFLPRPRRDDAYLDQPIPIGYGQTNSQPSTVRQLLEWLDVRPGNRVLDVGSGSGWSTALLSWLVGKGGFVYAVERIPELLSLGSQNCAKYHLDNVEFHEASDVLGLPTHAPYDCILVNAAAASLPEPLIDQLVVGGRMVAPVGHAVLEIHKTNNDAYKTVEHDGFIFVPLVGWLNQTS